MIAMLKKAELLIMLIKSERLERNISATDYAIPFIMLFLNMDEGRMFVADIKLKKEKYLAT